MATRVLVDFAYSRNSGWPLNLSAAGSDEITRNAEVFTISNPRRLSRDGVELPPPAVATGRLSRAHRG